MLGISGDLLDMLVAQNLLTPAQAEQLRRDVNDCDDKTEMLPERRMRELLDACDQLCNIIAQSIVTAKENKKRPVTTRGSSASW